MSVYTDWQMAQNQIINGDNLGYPAAIQYYNNLKERLFIQLRIQNNLSKDADAIIGKRIEEELEAMIHTLESKELSDLSSKSLEQIRDWVYESFEGQNGQELSIIANQIAELRSNATEDKKQTTKEIKRLQGRIKEMFDSENQLRQLAESALNNYASNNGADYNSVLSFLSSFLLNMVQWTAKNGVDNVFINKNARTTLMGYYKEIIEKKLLNELFSSINLSNSQFELIAGANTINDLLIPFGNLNGNFSTSEMISILSEETTEDTLIALGAQVKSRNFAAVKTDFMKISHQAGLLEAFNAQMSIQNNTPNRYSWCCGAVFLGQMQNILQCLGNNNVLFISGPNRMLMSAFIESFRKEQMYLAFFVDDNHITTNQVGLQRFVNRRTQKMLSRFY